MRALWTRHAERSSLPACTAAAPQPPRMSSRAGPRLPRSPMGPAPGNELGHWGESERIYELQRKLLAAAETSWDDVSPVPAVLGRVPRGRGVAVGNGASARGRISRNRAVRVQGSEDLPAGPLLARRSAEIGDRAGIPHPGQKSARGHRLADPPRRLCPGEGDPALAAAQPRCRARHPWPPPGVRLLRRTCWRTGAGLRVPCSRSSTFHGRGRAPRRTRARAGDATRRATSRLHLGSIRSQSRGGRVGEVGIPPPPRRVRGFGRPGRRRSRRNQPKRRRGGPRVRTSACGLPDGPRGDRGTRRRGDGPLRGRSQLQPREAEVARITLENRSLSDQILALEAAESIWATRDEDRGELDRQTRRSPG